MELAKPALGAGNLGHLPQSRRMRVGVVVFSFALVLAVLMLRLGLGTGYLLLLFVPFFVAANGLYMGLFGT